MQETLHGARSKKARSRFTRQSQEKQGKIATEQSMTQAIMNTVIKAVKAMIIAV